MDRRNESVACIQGEKGQKKARRHLEAYEEIVRSGVMPSLRDGRGEEEEER